MSEFICTLGPRDRRFEEQHERVAISAVVAGSFRYRTAAGKGMLHPGAFLLGDGGTCFECGHDHDGGDRCVAFHYDPAFFDEIAATAAGSHGFRFPVAMLPALRSLVPLFVHLETAAKGGDAAAIEDLAVQVAERVVITVAGVARASRRAAPKDQRRIATVLRHIEAHAEQPLDLEALARMACMSKYHFLRTFRATVGVTPHQHLLGVRMRRAALALCSSAAPVSTIALDAGFGDLSTFNNHFRGTFGMSPTVLRRSVGTRAAR